MFASAGIHVSRGGLFHHAEARRIGLHNFSSSMGTSSQKPFRKGVGFTTVSGLVMISGVIITVLGFMDVFDSGYTMMGMLMIAVAVLLFLGALRMFLVASKLRKAERTLQKGGLTGWDISPSVCEYDYTESQPNINKISRGTVASMVIEREDERGTLTVVMDTVNIEARCRRRSDDSNKPPDYAEATSDYYPESTSEIVIDTTNSEPPPPYGPPTYDQAIAEKVTECCGTELDDVDKTEQESITNAQHSNLEQGTETEQDLEQDEYISHGYQDMPSVTI